MIIEFPRNLIENETIQTKTHKILLLETLLEER
jgi:hypothetical protein